jgi:hypothetical protein
MMIRMEKRLLKDVFLQDVERPRTEMTHLEIYQEQDYERKEPGSFNLELGQNSFKKNH